MGLKLLLLLLLLVMRSSLSEKLDNGTKLDDSFFKRSMDSNFAKEEIFENLKRNSSYLCSKNAENRVKKIVQQSSQLNFGEENPLEKRKACESCTKHSTSIPNNFMIIDSPNQQVTPTLLEKKFLSDPRFKEILKSERDLNFLTTWLMNRKQSTFGKPEKLDRKGKRTKLRTVNGNELADKVVVMNQLRENALSYVRTKTNLKNSLENKSFVETRAKREVQEMWIEKDFEGYDDLLNMHAFIIRDEEVPQCGSTASKITNTRYFMCSGVILTSKFVLTTASCVHYAHIYEHHITAVLSVLIGAMSNSAYVLKVKKYEVHPEYKHNAESRDHALHNIAILTLACNIPSDVLVLPKFPGKYEDISHMCCSENCKILTVLQTPDNRHKIQLMSAKHIPLAVHDDDTSSGGDKYYQRKRRELSFVSKIKREGKIALPPDFLNYGPEKNAETLGNKNKPSDKSRNATEEAAVKEMSEELMRGLFRSGFNIKETNPFDADTSKMSEKEQQAIADFIKEITDKAMARVMKILDENKKTDGGSESSGAKEGQELVDNIAHTLKQNILKEIEDSLNPKNLFNDTLEDPSSKYYNCPPLGSPVIVNRTLLGLVAYTCDDLQSWVPWQYVNIDRNLKWIEDTIDGSENILNKFSKTQVPSGDENNIEASAGAYKDDKAYKDSQADYKSALVFDSIGKRFKKDQGESLKSIISEDRLFSKEITPVSEKKFLQNSENSLAMGKQFSGQNLVSKLNDEGPRIAVNKCFLNEDGTVICQSQTILEGN